MKFICAILAVIFSFNNAYAMQSYADIVEKLIPSVVNISTEKNNLNNDNDFENQMINPEFENRESLGSGFFIRDNGYILTNEHVIKGAKKINVITNDNINYEAKVIGKDNISDLAVLKIEKKGNEVFQSVEFGNADDTRIGDIILTFGNPYGLGVSVSQGIISAKSRNIGLNEQPYLQTDASINEGNSGGPMFNIEGEVIGINSAVFKKLGATGIGFSLPSNIANWVSTQIIDSGKVKRGWLGIDVSYGIDAKYTNKSGLLITHIDENSNAYKEGLRAGDIITHYDNTTASNITDFSNFISSLEIGYPLKLKALSFGEEIKFTVRIQEMPSSQIKHITNKALQESHTYNLKKGNVSVTYISEYMIAVQEVNPKGLEIVKIEKKSPFKNMGISVGDVILEADRSDIYTAENLLDSIRNAVVDEYRPISFLIQGVDDTFLATIEMVNEDD